MGPGICKVHNYYMKGDGSISNPANDIFYQAAFVWNELTEYKYIFTYGHKNKLSTINLTFSPEDFPYLMGLQYLKDLSLPRYNQGKIVSRILEGTISFEQIQKGEQYKKMVLPRLEALTRLKDTFENDFNLFSYMPRMYPFYTQIKADYLISGHTDIKSYVFLLQSKIDGTAQCDHLCCSAFRQEDRDYEKNQRLRALLKKERIHIPDGTSTVLLDKLVKQQLQSTGNRNSIDSANNYWL